MKISRSQEQWQNIIKEQKISGLTILDYCQQQQLSTSSFYAVRNKQPCRHCGPKQYLVKWFANISE